MMNDYKVLHVIMITDEQTTFHEIERADIRTFLALASRSAFVPFLGGLASFGGIVEP